jgi:hypothetical protein
MAESNIVAGLFGMNPQMYGEQQRTSALQEGITLAQLDPAARGAAMTYAGARGLGNAIGGAMGIEDPQLQMIAKRQQLLTQLDLTSPKSLIEGAKLATSSGDAQLAAGLIDRARSLQESQSKISLQQAQALKALQPNKLTGDERYIADLRTVESKILEGKEPTANELSNANMAAQMLAKPRSFFDQASGQTVTIPATDPSKAFPETFKAMVKTEAAGGIGVPKPTVQTATTGNIPAGSQKEISDIEASLVRLENTSPQLETFSNLLKSGDVKFNAAANAFDFLGAVVPPIFGGQEVGNQVKKDEFTRAFTERVNTVLNNAKGVQARDDAKRAEQQIASPSTFLSSARMQGAIDYLKKAESGYREELLARKGSLQRQGKPEASEVPSAKPTEEKPTPKPTQKVGEMTREQKIDSVIKFNASKETPVIVTRSQAEKALRDAGKL